MWKKGTQKELEIMALQRAERDRYMAAQRNLEAGETSEGTEGQPPADVPKAPPKAVTYTPPAFTAY